VYCRFLDRGLSKRFAASLCKSYEILVFSWIRWSIKTAIYVFCIMNRDYRILKEVRRK
jgi:hypothetical protein